jgi:hypothetical protein
VRAALLAVVGALVLPAGASAAAPKSYGGTNSQGLPVSFWVEAKKVTKFRARVRCVGSKVRTFKFPSMPVDSKGRFSENQAGPSVSGRITGNKARGTLTLPGCDGDADSLRFAVFSG